MKTDGQGGKRGPYCSAGQAGAPAPCVQEAGAVPEVHGKASRPQISSLTLKKKKKSEMPEIPPL